MFCNFPGGKTVWPRPWVIVQKSIFLFRISMEGWDKIEKEENEVTYSELISNCLNTMEYADDLGIR